MQLMRWNVYIHGQTVTPHDKQGRVVTVSRTDMQDSLPQAGHVPVEASEGLQEPVSGGRPDMRVGMVQLVLVCGHEGQNHCGQGTTQASPTSRNWL